MGEDGDGAIGDEIREPCIELARVGAKPGLQPVGKIVPIRIVIPVGKTADIVAGDPIGKSAGRRGNVESDVVEQDLAPGLTDQRDPEGLSLKRVTTGQCRVGDRHVGGVEAVCGINSGQFRRSIDVAQRRPESRGAAKQPDRRQ